MTPPPPRAQNQRDPIAIVGIGCRFPGKLSTPGELWQGLCARVDGIRAIPEDRWNGARFHDADRGKAGKITNPRMGFIDDVASFDAEFFGMFPTEAARVDPQQRLLLEVAQEAFDDAGAPRERVAGTRTSVFVGAFMYDYLCMQTSVLHQQDMNPHVAMGNSLTSLSNRLSYFFDLKGPSISIDTACSSSLVAVHLACRSIWAGEADSALAGGVNVMLRPESSILLSRAGFLNDDGKCKAFDARANGYVRGEGAGVVYLKPLSAAQRDDDRIYAVIHGSAVNQDGFVDAGFTVPNLDAQVSLLNAAYADAGIDPRTVSYVEAHGPGTAVGDPIEANALGTVLGAGRTPEDPVWIGSIKTNIGHLEGASGIAGLIKAALSLHARAVPPNLHFETPNPAIDFAGHRLRVPVKLEPLGSGASPLRAGVNSFGAGGTNAHIVLSSSEARQAHAAEPRILGEPRLFTVGAARRDGLAEQAALLRDQVARQGGALADISFSTWRRKTRHPHEAWIHARSDAELVERLEALAANAVHPGVRIANVSPRPRPKLALMFSGQGGQWARMGVGLMRAEPVFAQAMRRIDAAFAQVAGWPLLQEIERGADGTRIGETTVVQPATMAIQIAATELLRSYGIEAEGVVGHSIGEVAAAWAGGAYSLEDAAHVIYHRSRIQDRASGAGKMLAVGLSEDEARRRLAGREGRVEIATYNGPSMLALAGDAEAIAAIERELESEGIFARPVNVAVPYHSRFMDPLQADLRAHLGDFSGQRGVLPIYSTVSTKAEDGGHLGGDYWFRNVREPVRFHQTLQRMLQDGFDTFIEIGPHPVLVTGARGTADGTGAAFWEVMRRDAGEADTFWHGVGAWLARGGEVDRERLWGRDARFVGLPRYAWRRQRHWFENAEHARMRIGARAHPYLRQLQASATRPSENIVRLDISVEHFGYLRDHCVESTVVVPATAHVEAAHAAAFAAGLRDVVLEDLRFESALVLADDPRTKLEIRLENTSAEGHFTIVSRAEGAGEAPWTEHSRGRINALAQRFVSRAGSLATVREAFTDARRLNVEQFYDLVSRAGIDYGASFQCVTELWHQGNEVLARAALRSADAGGEPHFAHPALVDACLHAVFVHVQAHGAPEWVYLPSRLERVKVHRALPDEVWAHVRVRSFDATQLLCDTIIYDLDGTVVAELHGLRCSRLANAGAVAVGDVQAYEFEWMEEKRGDAAPSPAAQWRVVGPAADGDGLISSLLERLAALDPGAGVFRTDAGAADFAAQMRAALARGERIAWFPASSGVVKAEDADFAAAAEAEWLRFLQLSQAVAASGGEGRVVVVTRGQSKPADADGDDAPDAFGAGLVGMSRVLRNEMPGVALRVIDVSAQGDALELDALVAEMRADLAAGSAAEVALRGGRRFVRSLRPVDGEARDRGLMRTEPACGTDYEATVPAPGALNAIEFRRTKAARPGPGDVCVDVHAAALNFKDVMNGMGLLSREAVQGGLTEDRLGLEISGVVSSVGAGVSSPAVGEAVLARVPRGFVGRAVTPAACAIRKPDSLSFAEAAAAPVVYLTAYYGLHYLARLAPGETVLVHSATGGVGMAAISIARAKGARVIATAGSEAKRAFLRQEMRIEHVYDSRSVSFYDGVMDATGGRGVDVVLNSLTGALASESVRALAPFGRFIEIGKTDIYRNGKLGLAGLGENISFFVVDGDRLAIGRPELHRQLFEEVVDLLGRGVLAAPDVTSLPVAELGQALQRMSRGEHRGKLVAMMQGETVATLPPLRASFRSDRSYLITGGAGGFGLDVAEWLAERGAGTLVLASRRGLVRREDEERVEALRALGVEVRVERVDVGVLHAVEDLLSRLERSPRPLGGIVHGAAVLDDATIATVTPERFLAVVRPKAFGAWNLHAASQRHSRHLEHFIMLSSVSAVVGLYGQVAYAAANSFLDGLATHRQARGLPALSVNIGLLAEFAGMTRRAEEQDGGKLRTLLNSQGFGSMGRLEVLAKLDRAVAHGSAQRVIATVDWQKLALAYPQLARDPRFAELTSGAKAKHKRGGLLARLEALPTPERCEHLARELGLALAGILDLKASDVAVDRPLEDLGLDSLIYTQVRSWILRNLGVNYPMMRLLKGPSLQNLAGELVAMCEASGDGTAETAPDEIADLIEAGVQRVSPWLLRGRVQGAPQARVFCFPAVGTGASLFGSFLLSPPAGIEVFAVQAPGREDRSDEAAVQTVEDFVERLIPVLEPLLDRPFACWGHSFGGLVARHVIQRLEALGFKPNHLLVSASPAPGALARWRAREVLPRVAAADRGADALEIMKGYASDGGAARDLVAMMRKDAPMVVAYEPANTPLAAPITVIRARQDKIVRADELEPWRESTRNAFDLLEVDGDHWFLNQQAVVLGRTIARLLK